MNEKEAFFFLRYNDLYFSAIFKFYINLTVWDYNIEVYYSKVEQNLQDIFIVRVYLFIFLKNILSIFGILLLHAK